MTKLTPKEFELVSRTFEQIKRYDETIRNVLRHNDLDGLGKAARVVYGRYQMSHFQDTEYGEIIHKATLEALLFRRANAAETISHLIEVSDPPTIPSHFQVST